MVDTYCVNIIILVVSIIMAEATVLMQVRPKLLQIEGGQNLADLILEKYDNNVKALLAAAAADADPQASVDLSMFYSTDSSAPSHPDIEKDMKQCVELLEKQFEKPAARGFLLPCIRTFLGAAYDDNTEVYDVVDIQKAFSYYSNAASLGHRQAQLNLAQMYVRGADGVEKDESKAEYWFQCAEKDSDENVEKAEECYHRAEKEAKENPALFMDSLRNGSFLSASRTSQEIKNSAGVQLFKMYSATWTLENVLEKWENNDNSALDIAKGMAHLNKAAETGCPEAQVMLGDIYVKGNYGIPKDNRKAEYWLIKAQSLDNDKKDKFKEIFLSTFDAHDLNSDDENLVLMVKNFLSVTNNLISWLKEETEKEKIDPPAGRQAKPRLLNRKEIEEYALTSPSAKNCLKAFLSFEKGFDLIAASDYQDPEGFKHLVNGYLIEPSTYKHVFYMYQTQKIMDEDRLKSFIKKEYEAGSPYGVFMFFNVCTGRSLPARQIVMRRFNGKGLDGSLRKKMLSSMHSMCAGYNFGKEKYSLALTGFEEARRLNPTEISLLVCVGMSYKQLAEQLNENAELIHELNKPIPKPTDIITKSDSLESLEAIEDKESTDYKWKEAIHSLRSKCKKPKGDPEILFPYSPESNTHYKKSLKFFNKYLDEAPQCDRFYPEVLYIKACMLLMMKKQNWIKFYERALDLEKTRMPFLDQIRTPFKKILDTFFPFLISATCENCGTYTKEGVRLKQCACREVYYCGKTCQQEHLGKHGLKCPIILYKTCHFCNDISPNKDKMRCTKCKKGRYCNKDCQTSHWKVHKKDCRKGRSKIVPKKALEDVKEEVQDK